MSDENITDQKRKRRHLEWANAAVIGAVIGAVVTLLVTEIYSGWEKRRELGNVEKQIQLEIATNLETIDAKLWRLEPLGTYPEPPFTKLGDVGKFKSLLNISYTIDSYRRHDEQIDLLNNSNTIRHFYIWLDDSAKMQSFIASQYEHLESDAIVLDREQRLKELVFYIQRQGIYLYVYGCEIIIEIRPSCVEKLGKIQLEFQILKKTPEPIIDIPSEKLHELLGGWSRVIDESF